MGEQGLRSGRLASIAAVGVVGLLFSACGSSGLPVTIAPDAATQAVQATGVKCEPSGGVVIFSGNVTSVNNQPKENTGLTGTITNHQGTNIGSSEGPSIVLYEGVSSPFIFSVPFSGGTPTGCSLTWGSFG